MISDAPQELVDIVSSHLGIIRLVTECRGGVTLSKDSPERIKNPDELELILTSL